MPTNVGFDATKIWNDDELLYTTKPFAHLDDRYGDAVSKYNPTPGTVQLVKPRRRLARHTGTGKTGYAQVTPNPFPFYSESERYVPVIQPDGGQLSGAHTATTNQPPTNL